MQNTLVNLKNKLMVTQNKTPMITQLRTLTFFKENGLWYVECEEWVEHQTKLFRETHTYTNEAGKTVKYNEEQDFDDPLDDHTKHPDWSDPSRSRVLVMDDSFVALIEQKAQGADRVQLDMISYGWVSDTFAHYLRDEIGKQGARYVARFATPYPETFLLTPIFHFLFAGAYPLYIHVK